jgi:hypothetical protein
LEAAGGEEKFRRKGGRPLPDLETKPLKTEWKVELAEQVRVETGASVSWLAQRLKIRWKRDPQVLSFPFCSSKTYTINGLTP